LELLQVLNYDLCSRLFVLVNSSFQQRISRVDVELFRNEVCGCEEKILGVPCAMPMLASRPSPEILAIPTTPAWEYQQRKEYS
jgi:hypothetical protein